jgi:hypothetical protein
MFTTTDLKINLEQESSNLVRFIEWEYLELSVGQTNNIELAIRVTSPVAVRVTQHNFAVVNEFQSRFNLVVHTYQVTFSSADFDATCYLHVNLKQKSSASLPLFSTTTMACPLEQVNSLIVSTRNYEEIAIIIGQRTSSVGAIRDSTLGWITSPVIESYNQKILFK